MKYFVVSDIHSYYSIFKNALDKAGFDKKNPEHILIVCGDLFDRGSEPRELYKYLKSLNKDRLILIRGNHEDLYLALLKKDFLQSHDFYNGTADTFCYIANVDPHLIDPIYWRAKAFAENRNSTYYANKPYEYWQEIKKAVSRSAITKWLKSDIWKNYYEIDNYIFVHGFIPIALKEEIRNDSFWKYYPKSEISNKFLTYDSNWRNADNYEWSEARWGNPFDQYDLEFYKDEKYLVHGHWHCSEGHKRYEHIEHNYYPCIHEKLISIDACTAYSQQVNILVIDENKPYYYSKFYDTLCELKSIPIIETVSVRENNEKK